MTKKSLGQLFAEGEILQKAAGLTKDFGQLNTTVLEILREHLDKVFVQLKRGRTHAIAGYYDEYRITWGRFILKIPVRELRKLDSGVAEKVRKIMFENTKIADLFVRAAFGVIIPEELWEVELPAGIEVNANLDFHGVGHEITDRPMTVREAMNMAQGISVPYNVIGSQWRRVRTPYGVLYREDYAQNMTRGHIYGFSPNEELLKYAAAREIAQYWAGERKIVSMDQAVLSADVFDKSGKLVAWFEWNQNRRFMKYHVDGGSMFVQYLVWREVMEAIPAGGFAILETTYSGVLKLTAEALEAYKAPIEAVVEYDYREDGVYLPDGQLAENQIKHMWKYVITNTKVGDIFHHSGGGIWHGYFQRCEDVPFKFGKRENWIHDDEFHRWQQIPVQFFVPEWYKSLVGTK